MGLLLGVVVHPADVQDRDGAEPLLRQARRLFLFVERIIGDAGYQGPRMAAAVARTGRLSQAHHRRVARQCASGAPRQLQTAAEIAAHS